METNDKTSPVTPEKDRNSVSLDLMHRMRLHGMAAAFSESLQATFAETMTPDSFLNWLLSREWDYRVARNIERLVKGANFRYNDASVAQIDYTLPRGLDRNQMERLASLDFVRKGDNLFITGCAGTGKSYLATALGYEACKAGMRVMYANASKLMGTLKIAKNKGTIEAELKKLEKNATPNPRRPLSGSPRCQGAGTSDGNHRRPARSQVDHRNITAPRTGLVRRHRRHHSGGCHP